MGQAAKYSCCLYPTGKETLDEAEVLMLESYCEKAQIKDGMDILDLGCGIYPSAHSHGYADTVRRLG